ncbi:MAG TPA: polysaccharide deacetylase family protein [Stellaceae bacterium]|nr:polysaccharide deacetylase family protein [Stellaceae bacterium]
MPESGWADLETELDIWQSADRTANFWWRDDDAVTSTPALRRLLALAEDVPIGLAVIPGEARAELARSLEGHGRVALLQHGWRHTNHAGSSEKKSELGSTRPLRQRLDELTAGRDRLRSLFGDRALPILVPPWNRIGEDLIPELPALGFRGLSMGSIPPLGRREGPLNRAETMPGLRQVHVHVDLIDWHGTRGFISEGNALSLILRHLGDRRRHGIKGPIGILTHHLVQDAETDDFLRQLFGTLGRHRAARLARIPELFS